MNNTGKHYVAPHNNTEFINTSSPSASSPINANASYKLAQLPHLPSITAKHEFIHNDILHVNVGGRVFTTTKNTMTKSGLFHKLLSSKGQNESKTNKADLESVKRQTTFENYCVEHLENQKKDEIDGVYEIHSNYYFVDRSPSKFDDILHFLRDYPTVNSQQFIDRYYAGTQPQKSMRRNSLSSSLSISSSLSSSIATSDNNISLLKLQDEARFYEIEPLISSIQEKLDEFHHNNVYLRNDEDGYDKYKWWDKTGSLKGLRRLSGTRIAFATSMDNWVAIESTFEIPTGFKWCTQSEYLEEYHSERELLATYKEWIHFGIGGWNNYRWKYARKVAFMFKDTFKSQRFVHSGMEVCDINHVKSLCGYMSESPLMEYDESKGIIEGFAGLVLISDEAWFDDESRSPPTDTDTWTSEEDDEQIQSLKRKQLVSTINNNNKLKKKRNKTAPVSISHLPPPQLANAFAEYTKKQRQTLTKNDKQNTGTFIPLHHSPNYIHQLPHYSNIYGCGPLPSIPAPQLQPRLSVNSLPLKTTNHNLLMHHQNQKQ